MCCEEGQWSVRRRLHDTVLLLTATATEYCCISGNMFFLVLMSGAKDCFSKEGSHRCIIGPFVSMFVDHDCLSR